MSDIKMNQVDFYMVINCRLKITYDMGNSLIVWTGAKQNLKLYACISFSIFSGRISCFFFEALTKVTHLVKAHAGCNIPNCFI